MDRPEILVVEDEPEARAILANELQAKGARKQVPFFDAYFVKGSFGRPEHDIFENLNIIVEKATNYENSRFSEIPEALFNLKIKYRIADTDFFELVGSRRM